MIYKINLGNADKNIWEKINKYSGLIAIVIALIIYCSEQSTKENSIDRSIAITSCLNEKIADNMIKSGNHDWLILGRYETKIYFENLPSFLNNYNITATTSRGIIKKNDVKIAEGIVATIHNMETSNRLLDQVDFTIPFMNLVLENSEITKFRSDKNTEIANNSKEIKHNLELLGYSITDCEKLGITLYGGS